MIRLHSDRYHRFYIDRSTGTVRRNSLCLLTPFTSQLLSITPLVFNTALSPRVSVYEREWPSGRSSSRLSSVDSFFPVFLLFLVEPRRKRVSINEGEQNCNRGVGHDVTEDSEVLPVQPVSPRQDDKPLVGKTKRTLKGR